LTEDENLLLVLEKILIEKTIGDIKQRC